MNYKFMINNLIYLIIIIIKTNKNVIKRINNIIKNFTKNLMLCEL